MKGKNEKGNRIGDYKEVIDPEASDSSCTLVHILSYEKDVEIL